MPACGSAATEWTFSGAFHLPLRERIGGSASRSRPRPAYSSQRRVPERSSRGGSGSEVGAILLQGSFRFLRRARLDELPQGPAIVGLHVSFADRDGLA